MKEAEGNPVHLARRLARALAATAVVAAALVLPASPVSAAGTYTVNTYQDAPDDDPGDGSCATSGGACTLRAAIQEANATPGATTTITFEPGVTTLELTVTGGSDGDGSDQLGDLDVESGVHVVVVGNRVAADTYTTVKADQLDDRHFEVAAGATLDLVDVTLAGGESAGDGGAILASGAVTVTNSPAAGNDDGLTALYANRADGDGGAVAVRAGGSFVVKNSSTEATGSVIYVSQNSAGGDGGAIVNDGTVELSGTGGGAMPSQDVYLDTNSADGDGGGIANRTGTVTIGCRTAVRFSSATAGGDVYNAAALWVSGGMIDGGVASTGGGLFNGSTGDVQFKDSCEPSQLSRSSASIGGQLHNEGTVTVQQGSGVSVTGGADSIDPSRTVEAATGAGISQFSGTFQVDGWLMIDGVRAGMSGGGLHLGDGTFATGPDGQVIVSRSKALVGGGLHVAGGSATVRAVLDRNTATQGGGAMVASGSLELHRSSVLRGTADDGGGVAVTGGALTLLNSTIAGNSSTSPGAAFWSTGGSSTLRHVTIVDNGSGVTVEGTAAVVLQRSLLTRNSAWNCAVLSPLASITMGDFNVVDTPDCNPTGTDLTDTSRFADVTDGLDHASPGTEPEAYEPLHGSPAIDVVTDAGCGTPADDQEGNPRPTDGDGDGDAACDAGAVEADDSPLLESLTGTVLWESTGLPEPGVCVIGLPVEGDVQRNFRAVTGEDGTYDMAVADDATYLVAFYAPLPPEPGDETCDGEPDFTAAQPEWYRNVAVEFESDGDVVFPEPSTVALIEVDGGDVSDIDACLGAGPGAGADAPCPAPPAATGTPAAAGPVAGPAATSGAPDDATAVGAGASGSGPPGARLAMTGTEVHGLWLTGVLLVACGAMVMAASRRELRLARR